MAYGNSTARKGYGSNTTARTLEKGTGTSRGEDKRIFSTGMFKPKTGKKAVATAFVKEAITIPANSSLVLVETSSEKNANLILRLDVFPNDKVQAAQ